MKHNITSKWDELSNPHSNFECEELVLRNTFVNAQMGPLADLRFDPNDNEKSRAIKWLDNDEADKTKLVTNKSEEDLIYKEEVDLVDVHRRKAKGPKSTIKPFDLNLAEITGVSNIV